MSKKFSGRLRQSPLWVFLLALGLVFVHMGETRAQVFQWPTAAPKAQPKKAVKKAKKPKKIRRVGTQKVTTNRKPPKIIQRANQGTVGVISGGFGSTNLRIVSDLATVLNEKQKLRLLPMIGQGSVQNIDDILYLKGIDVGIVQSDVFEIFKKKGSRSNITRKVHYISKLFNVEFHLIGGNDIQSIEDLAGKKVSFGVEGSGTHITASTVFEQLGINVEPVALDFHLAVQKVKSGEIAALAYVSGKPTSVVSQLRRESGLRLIPVDYAKPLRETYYPAYFSSGDYPGLVEKGSRVPSISVGTIMAVYNWTQRGHGGARYRKVQAFIDAFFERYKELSKEPRHPKWREMNIAAEVPGWTRYPPAQKRLVEELKKRKSGL